jgi:hypothetical protein
VVLKIWSPVLLFRQVLLRRQPCLAKNFLPYCPDQTRLDANAAAIWKMDEKSINGQWLAQVDATSYYLSIL